ncbi:MAG: DUF814 domain-containing protein [Candidatus Micrarchaeota archaeon]|nr:DUF814 domain-containing protein [Candidatus Micrarchaeota archaeon]
MEIEIDLTKSAQQNANDYFYRSKRAKKKAEGAQQSIKELETKLQKAKERYEKAPEAKKVKLLGKKEWYEKFHWFFASDGSLAIGGRDASQNELINSRYFEEGDLFFHADIFGASVVILKGGTKASAEVKEETAQFAACYSSAWKEGQATVNVYALGRSQVTKSKSGGSLGAGAFALSGEREWFRNVRLELVASIKAEKLEDKDVFRLIVMPSRAAEFLGISGVRIVLGKSKKSDAAKAIAKRLGYEDLDYVMQQLPTGGISIK